MNTKHLFCAMAAFIWASCSDHEGAVPQDNLKGTPITVTAAVAELATRAGYGSESLPATFYLNVDNPADDKYDYASMMKYEDGKWVSYTADGAEKRTMIWDDAKTIVTATAATYPFTDASALTVQPDQRTENAIKASDYLYMANKAVDPKVTDGKLPVTLAHIMSKVKLTITLTSEFINDTNPISDVTIADIKPWEDTYAKPDARYEVILAPQTVAAGKFAVTFNIGERTFKWTSPDAVTLESGSEYTLTLNVGRDKINEVSFSASAWGNGNDGNENIEIETE